MSSLSALPHEPQYATHEIDEAISSLALPTNHVMLYSAGLPMFPSNFTRDGVLSAILLRDQKMLRDQLTFCAIMQGTRKNKYTGEEPGKIYHEMPPVKFGNLSTEYNACDATALFLYGHEVYLQLTEDYSFIYRQKQYLEKAVEYILRHLINNLFAEDPKFSGGKRFALRVTYWKDSQIHNREGGLPAYPIVYTLAHVQNMCALRSAAKLLRAKDLEQKASNMLRSMGILFNEKKGAYNVGVDQRGFITGISSDNLHMLYYLEKGDLPENRIAKIVKATKVLETPLGYRTLDPSESYHMEMGTIEEGYHTRTVWPFEQAYIHIAAQKFGLKNVSKVSERIVKHLNTYPELFIFDERGYRTGGSRLQLWTVAAKHYFQTYFASQNKF